MNPYYQYAVENGYQVYFYDPDSAKDQNQAKFETATDMAERINAHPNNEFYLFGHSAGADATILAASQTSSDNVKGVGLLDPSMTATIPGQEGDSIQRQADQLTSMGINVFLADTPNDGIDASIFGATEISYNYSHIDLATKYDVFKAAIDALFK